jgi:cytoskeletal protein CcmA (bactofilin family)
VSASDRGALPGEPESVLPPGSEFEGLVSLVRAGRIEGRVRGEIVACGALWIAETARVEGRIEAEEVVISGEVTGEVRARDRIELRPTARVRAALEAPRLVAAEGCFLEGPCAAGEGVGPGGPSAGPSS